MWFSLPFGAGCLACQYLLPERWRAWCALAALAAALGARALGDRRVRRLARIACAGLAAGVLWYAGYAGWTLAPAAEAAGREDLAVMELTDYPEETAYGARAPVRAEGVRGGAVYFGDRALLDLEPGDRIEAAVRYDRADLLSGGEESSYYTSRGIFTRLYGEEGFRRLPGRGGALRYLPQRMARDLREAAEHLYGQPARGLILALLTGERDMLEAQSLRDLREAGLLHVTAVSGLHCGFLIALLGLLTLRRQKLTALLGYPVLLLYMLVVGCTPSVVRSCVMVGFVLLAPLAGREGDAPTALSGALLVILLANPFAAASVSLQLSFAAVAGLLLVTPRVQAVLAGPRLEGTAGAVWRFVTGTISASAGVMVMTAPLSAVYFGALSLVSPLANLTVLWMAPVLFACALIGTVLGALGLPLAPLTGAAEAMARYLLWAAGALAGIPGHQVRFDGVPAALWLLFMYTLLGICVLSRDRARKYVFALAAAAVCLGAVKAVPRMLVRDDALTAVAVDVGQGAGTLLHAGTCTALVDCGSLGGADRAGEAVAGALDRYGWERLDCVVLTHYHEDHAGGLEGLLARVEVETLLLPQLLGGAQAELQRQVLVLADRYGAAVRYVEEPLEAALGETARLTVYPPVTEGGVNEEGLTILCSAGDFELLITGDMNAAAERELVSRFALPDIEVLLAGHHGSKYSTGEELLSAVTPEVGVISVGENRFGHPTQEAMERMAAAGMDLYRTDWQGSVLIRVLKEKGGEP